MPLNLIVNKRADGSVLKSSLVKMSFPSKKLILKKLYFACFRVQVTLI